MEQNDRICEFTAFLPPMNAEAAISDLMASGALDAYTVTSFHGRIQLHVLCRENRERVIGKILCSMAGSVACSYHTREILQRRTQEITSPYGTIRRKTALYGNICRSKLEFDDLKRLADTQGISLREARCQVEYNAPKDNNEK